ncbi:MAG: peptidoglycan DD-metalloendopeptidase family protein [Legionellales bacterium]|nr:peptidoglycan DD-metalloendopeptidase family protein [Legionellales bacterium]
MLILASLNLTQAQAQAQANNSPDKSLGQGYYVVKKDDTLYSIAWQFGLDYRVIVAMNHLSPPYALVVGESLFLVEKGHTAPPGLGNPPVVVKHLPSSTSNSSGATVPASQKVVASQSSSSTVIKSVNWIWPTQGKVIKAYSMQAADLNKGVDIQGKLGQNIVASASGEVVYSGNGIPGYGNLIIIKHNADYLTAYAHNEKNLVKEGEHVKVGQAIALMGRGNTGTPILHFEIRYRGKPINPSKVFSK